jgi:hypothetical protein
VAWRLKSPPLALDVMFSRLVLISIGAFSIWWGLITFPVFWREARLDSVADRILEGEEFKPETLETVLSDADAAGQGPERAEFLRSAAVVQFKLVELAMEDDNAGPSGPLLDRLDAAARRSLAVAPADSYLWLALFFAKVMKGESAPLDFDYLRMSYQAGPHEGWVAVLRNYIALRYISDLPPDLAEAAVAEFKDLVASAYYQQAIEVFRKFHKNCGVFHRPLQRAARRPSVWDVELDAEFFHPSPQSREFGRPRLKRLIAHSALDQGMAVRAHAPQVDLRFGDASRPLQTTGGGVFPSDGLSGTPDRSSMVDRFKRLE